MTWEAFERVWPILAVLCALAGITFLRVLALYRHQELAPHDLAREANRLRREYLERKRREETDNIVV